MTDIRELLAAALEQASFAGKLGHDGLYQWECEAAADALLPVVDRIASERAAAELEKAAEELRNHQATFVVKASDLIGTPVMFDREVGRASGYGAAAQRVTDRAAALRAATGEGAGQ